jgi:hypothetical protein
MMIAVQVCVINLCMLKRAGDEAIYAQTACSDRALSALTFSYQALQDSAEVLFPAWVRGYLAQARPKQALHDTSE